MRKKRELKDECYQFKRKLRRMRLQVVLAAGYKSKKECYKDFCRIMRKMYIKDEDLIERAERIKPLVCYKGRLYFIRPYDIKNESWYSATKKNIMRDKQKNLLAVKDIIEEYEFQCYHNGNNHGFRPTMSEVFSQIPEDVDWRKVDCFEVKPLKYNMALDIYESVVTFYRLAHGLPKIMQEQPIICAEQ